MGTVELHHYLESSFQKWPERPAVIEPDQGSINYAELYALSSKVRDSLREAGIGKGDRIGIMLPKSADSVACIYGILMAGACYVPIDVTGPANRAAYILSDCDIKLCFIDSKRDSSVAEELSQLGHELQLVALADASLGTALERALSEHTLSAVTHNSLDDNDDLAYILYTSGSTGNPKGVPLRHANAIAFIDWCSELLSPNEEDRFSAHAPFHFDLSILDLYTPIKHGAAIVLIGESTGKEPLKLAEVIEQNHITIWYSAPSILTMLLQFGHLADKDLGSLRSVLFAGEVFPVSHLRNLMRALPKPSYVNLYGPTETNVSTYAHVPTDFPNSEATALPIGKVCEHLKALVVDAEGNTVKCGETGELIISGANVMNGYWNLPEQTQEAFLHINGLSYYRTGDLVSEDSEANYNYLGRRDRMVKKRGFRVELGEIEAKLHLHENILEVAAIAVSDDEGVHIYAHVVTRDQKKISLIKLKRFCSEHLPVYMIPDGFRYHEKLHKTSTDKVDYQALITLHKEEKSKELA
ncbi:MAG: amino acid adenylation domain-containing protein [Flavobacteriales bacterium]|jgi:amino acid adenylation domain-containing protein